MSDTEPASAGPIKNLGEARFECTFGRGCDGICCREGQPPIYPEEIARIDESLERVLPELRPEARAAVRKAGYISRRRKAGQLTLRVVSGWCVFFNRGCVLHRVGAQEGDKFRYKPAACALFPIDKDDNGRWYVRQKGYAGEIWDLPCLDPENTTVRATDSLQEEIALALRFSEEATGSESAAPTPERRGGRPFPSAPPA
jgi:hypothetical protein